MRITNSNSRLRLWVLLLSLLTVVFTGQESFGGKKAVSIPNKQDETHCYSNEQSFRYSENFNEIERIAHSCDSDQRSTPLVKPSKEEFIQALKVLHLDPNKEFNSMFSKCGFNSTGKVTDLLERLSIYLYTSHISGIVNSKLAENDVDRIRAYVDMLKVGLSRLDNYQGVVKRGYDLRESEKRLYQPGKTIKHSWFTSASIDKPFDKKDCFEILSKTGKLIRDYSDKRGENEVLFAPDTYFEVQNIISVSPPEGNCTTKYFLKETDK